VSLNSMEVSVSDGDVFEIVDASGQLRRHNVWAPPKNFVSAFRPYDGEPELPLYDESDLRKVLAHPRRRKIEEILDPRIWIQNQLQYSSCTGWGTAIALSKSRWLRGIKDQLILSGSFVYSLINGGRDNGSPLEDALRVIQQYGAPPASMVGPTMIFPRLQPKAARDEALKHKGLEAYRAVTKQGWDTGLACGFQGVAVVHAGRNFTRMSRISTSTSCSVRAGVDNGPGNHCVNISDIRYIGGELHYLLDNSWGLDGFGEMGRAWVTWDHFDMPFNQGGHHFFLIPSSEEA